MPSTKPLVLFPPFHPSTAWRAIDDRVRGGASQSYLEAYCPGRSKAGAAGEQEEKQGLLEKGRGGHEHDARCGVRFFGHLDISTLGGAGFASQTHTFEPTLSVPPKHYSGIALTLLAPALGPSLNPPPPRQFTLTLKASLPADRPDGRRESTISYEHTFTSPVREPTSPSPLPPAPPARLIIPFDAFAPTFRGREVPRGDERYVSLTDELGKAHGGIVEMGLMCRSGFGKQEGDFELFVGRIEVLPKQQAGFGAFLRCAWETVTQSWAAVDGQAGSAMGLGLERAKRVSAEEQKKAQPRE